MFCRLEHVVPWVIQGADWLPGTRAGSLAQRPRTLRVVPDPGRRSRRPPRPPSRRAPDRGRVLRHPASARVGEGRRALAQRQLDPEDRRPNHGGGQMARFVLVHGAWHGAWCYDAWRGPCRRRSRGRHVRPARPRRRHHAARSGHARHLRPARRGGHRRRRRARRPRRPQHGRDRGDAGRRARAGADRAARVPHGVPPEGRREPAVPRRPTREPRGHRGAELRDRAARRDHPRLGGTRRLLPPLLGGDADAAVAQLNPQPLPPLGTPASITPQRAGGLERHYIACTDDRAIPIALQRRMISESPCATVTSRRRPLSPFICARGA